MDRRADMPRRDPAPRRRGKARLRAFPRPAVLAGNMCRPAPACHLAQAAVSNQEQDHGVGDKVQTYRVVRRSRAQHQVNSFNQLRQRPKSGPSSTSGNANCSKAAQLMPVKRYRLTALPINLRGPLTLRGSPARTTSRERRCGYSCGMTRKPSSIS